MEKSKKIKFFLGITYCLIVFVFLWLIFSKFSFNELTSYEFIRNNRNFLIGIKESNFIFTIIIFFFFTAVWVLLLGFGTPIALMGGFIFGKWFGTIVVSISLSTGATLLYLFANIFLKEMIKEKFSKKFISLNEKFKKNEFVFFIIYRFVGGIPFFIANILPTLFNVKIKNYFFGTFLGIVPQMFIWVTLGSNLEKIINERSEAPKLTEIIFSPEIYMPILGFILLLILGVVVKNFFYKR